jgi:hypothetical protein
LGKRRYDMMANKGMDNKGIAKPGLLGLVITAAIIGMLLTLSPAQAFNLALSDVTNDKPFKGEETTFTGTLNIETDEIVPLTNVSLVVDRPGNAPGRLNVCTFALNGTPLEGCEGIQITLEESTVPNVYGPNEFEYRNQTFDYGFGYGSLGSGHITYSFVLDTTEFNTGAQDLYLTTSIGDDTFTSDPVRIVIRGRGGVTNQGRNN